MLARLAVAIVLEIAYAVFTRTWLRAHASGIELELCVTGCRAVSAALYWLMFRDLLDESRPMQPTRSWLWLAAGILALMLVPLLFYGGYPADGLYRTIFALTSIVVAVREEMFYRGVIQSLLAKRFGFAAALAASNVLFVLYHYGAQPLNLISISETLAMGCVLGLIYYATGTLFAPIALHASYDAMWSVGPIIQPTSDLYRIPFDLLGAALILAWVRVRR